jgi:transmembrane sensor
MTAPLGRHVRPALPAARVDRMWRAVDARSTAAHGFPWRAVAAAVPLGALAVIALLVHGRGRAVVRDGMEGSVIDGGNVTLADGSHVVVSEGGRLRIERLRDDSVVLALDRGSVDVAAPHTRRTLVVRTPRFDVVDLGTRFRVVLAPDQSERVDVSEGSVEVRGRSADPAPRRLVAGDSWSSAAPVPAPEPAPARAPAPASPSASEPSPALSPAPDTVPYGPRELLEVAQRAKLAGQTRAAAAAFDALRRRFRSDPRAALAAFELGRLRLEGLGDAPGAVEAFDDAIALAPGGPLREDAEARRVEALAVQGSPRCSAARDAFLARFPRSAHAAVVAGRCAPP